MSACALRARALLVVLALSLGACGGPVMQPIWGVDLPPVNAPPDAREADIAAVLNDIALQVGFADHRERYDVSGAGQIFLDRWDWPEHPSTYLTLARNMHGDPDIYTVLVGDSRTEGRYLIGPACEKYLLIVPLLKARFGDGVKFEEASCDPARPPGHW
jgi:hypothetical protein